MTIFNWHETCRKPDVKFSVGLGVPTCSSCGCIATLEGIAEAQHHDAPLVPAPTTRFELRWPLSLSFVDDPSAVSDLPEKTTAEPKTPSSKDVRGNVTPHVGQPTTSNQEPAANSSIRLEAPYEPLVARKIRLLKLLKGNYNDPVRVELRVADLAIKPRYEALSYTWADENKDSSKCERVYIGDRWDILLVTKNCFNALRRLRYSARSRKLWVDAICINQNDVGERSHQVGIMQNIYATASRVLIYLGEDKEDLNAASSPPWNYDKWNEQYKRSLPAHKDLTQQPYFKRVWVIQEIAAAQDCWVLYGTRGDRLQDFLLRNDVKYCDRNIKWLQMLPKEILTYSEKLPSLLLATALCKATDPRDKLFALLGLLQDAKQVHLNADYSLSKEQVFGGFTAYLLSQSPAFMLPIFAALQPRLSDSCPSWAVDWSSATNLDCMGPYLAERYSLLTAESDSVSVAYMPRFRQKGLLVLRGRLVTSLSSCVFTPECQRGPPGVLGQVLYGVRGTKVPDVLPNWAEPTDEICRIQGLDGYALVLRPVTKDSKTYRFVAICEQPVFHRLLRCLDSIDRTATLLFSIWSYILKAESKDQRWFLAQTWDTVEEICRDIKHVWNLRKPLCRSPDSTRDPTFGKNPSCEEVQAAPYKLRNPITRGMRSQHEKAPSDSRQQGVQNQPLSKKSICDLTVHQPFFDKTSPRIRRFRRMAIEEIDPFGLLRERLSDAVTEFPYSSRGGHGWDTLSDLKAHARLDSRMDMVPIVNLWWESESFVGIFAEENMALPRRAPVISQHKFPWHFTPSEMYAAEALMRVIGNSDERGSVERSLTFTPPKEFAALLLKQGLGEKLTFLLQSTQNLQNADVHREADRDEVFIWLQDALNLESRPLSTKESYENAYLDTWAADFIRAWTLLMNDDHPRRSRLVELADILSKETEELLLQEQGYLAAAEATWAPLLDLVKQTEARLLPMKEAFIRADDTHDESMDGVPWEDIFIA